MILYSTPLGCRTHDCPPSIGNEVRLRTASPCPIATHGGRGSSWPWCAPRDTALPAPRTPCLRARRRCTLLKSRRAPTPLGRFLARRPLILVFSGDPGSLLPPFCSLRSNARKSPTVRDGAPWRLNQVFQAFACAAEQNLLHLMQAVAAASCAIKTTCHGAIATRVNITRGRRVLVARRLQVQTVPTGRCATAML